MGIIKWWNDKWNKPTEVAQEQRKPSEIVQHFLDSEPIAQDKPVLSDDTRVKNYIDGGGEIVDMSNKPRKDGDGFPPDLELLTPFNRAHEGTKAGLNALMRGGKR
jgi:hypothetical protein